MILFYFVTISLLSRKYISNATASLSIAIRVDSMGHLLVSYGIIKEDTDFRHDLIVVSPNEVNSTRCESFRTLGGIAHYKNGVAKAWGFFLNAA